MEKIFLKLFEENKQKLIRICMFYEKNTSDRMDLYQEIAYQVWRSLKTFRKDSNINTWLYRIAINTAISFRRKNKKSEHNVPIDNYRRLKSDYDLQKETESNEHLQLIYEAIECLDKLDQAIILIYLEGFNYKEISDITGLKENNIAVRMNRIKNKIKKMAEVNDGY